MLKSDGTLGIYGQTGKKTGGVKKGEENSDKLPDTIWGTFTVQTWWFKWVRIRHYRSTVNV